MRKTGNWPEVAASEKTGNVQKDNFDYEAL
jgi:hypothetical protein